MKNITTLGGCLHCPKEETCFKHCVLLLHKFLCPLLYNEMADGEAFGWTQWPRTIGGALLVEESNSTTTKVSPS